MKKYLAAILLALISTAAYADGSPCEDVGAQIGALAHKKNTGHATASDKGVLAAAYQTYYQSGCSESGLKKYFKNGETPKSKKDVIK